MRSRLSTGVALAALVLIAPSGAVAVTTPREGVVAAPAPRPAHPASAEAVNAWQLIGPVYSSTPAGGQLTGLVADIDAHNLRVLGRSGGLWRFNFGAIPMTDSIPSSAFGSCASPPSDPSTILVGAQSAGLYKSVDGGATWKHLALPQSPTTFARIRYSPDGSVIHVGTNLGYYRSTDGGTTWQSYFSGDVLDLCMVNGMPDTLFLTWELMGQLRLYRSTNAGLSWSDVGSLGVLGSFRGAVSAAVSASSIVVLVNADQAMWRSTDDGSTWTQVLTYSEPPNAVAVSICPSDPTIALAGHTQLYRSTDGGASWASVSSPVLGTDGNVFAWDDAGVGVWVGMDQGWFQSGDRGATWSASSNVMPITSLNYMDCERAEIGAMLGAGIGLGVVVTPNEAPNWTNPDLGVNQNGGPVAIDQFAPQRMWAGVPVVKLKRSDDSGVTWSQVGFGLPTSGATAYLCTDNAPVPRLFWGQGFNVYESADTGSTFAQSNPVSFAFAIIDLASSQRVSPSSVLYATTNSTGATQRLFVRDGGTWSDRSAGLPAGSLVKVVPHPWAAFADEAWAIFYPQRIYHTTDRGVSWTEVTGDLPASVVVHDIVINPHASELYVGTDAGCWRTLNSGVNWEPWVNGIQPYVRVLQMSSIDQTGSNGPFSIVAVTQGRSVFKRDATGSDLQPAISVSEASCIEGNSGTTPMIFHLVLSTASSLPVYVNYSTVDGTAVAGSDYQAASGTITFSPGQTQATVTVLVNGDTEIEPDETFSLMLTNPIRATIANSAVTGTIEDDDAHALVDQSMPIVDGAVDALVLSGDTLFVGGAFSHVGPATGGGVPFDGTTGAPAWLPKVAGSVLAVAADGQGGWYIGGNFDHVDGLPRQNLAHLLADHTLAPWNPGPNGIVYTLLLSNGVVYFGGGFTLVGGVTRNDIAAVDATSGSLTPWDPESDGLVVSLALGAGTIYAGGDFARIGGQARSRIAELNLATGLALTWNPGASDEVDALLLSGGTLYAGGRFDTLGAAVRHKLAAVDATTGSPDAWNPGADLPVLSLATDGTLLFAGGDFSTIGGQPRSYLAELDPSSNTPTGWNPGADQPVFALAVSGSTLYAAGQFATIGGQSRGYLAALDRVTGVPAAWDPEPNAATTALALQGGQVMAGGSFSTVAGQPRANLAALSASTGALLGWNPGADGTVTALALNGHTLYAGGTFATLGGVARARIGAVDANTGLTTSWNPGANARVWALLPVGNSVVAGGQFTSIGGAARNGIAALSASSGAATSWNPDANSLVAALATDGTVVYAGGAFTNIGGAARNGLAALNGTNGAATSWNPAPNSGVTALQVVSGSVIAAGSFTTIGGVGRGRAAIIASNGAVSAWNPAADGTISDFALAGSGIYMGGGFGSLGGRTRHHLGVVTLSSVVDGWAPEPNNTVNAMVTAGSALWVGGIFTEIGGLPQAHLARLISVAAVDVPPPIATRSQAIALELGPNPTRGALQVRYAVPGGGRVRIGVYDVTGRRIGPLVDRVVEPGPHVITWNGGPPGRDPTPGVYFLRLEAAGRNLTRRFVIVR